MSEVTIVMSGHGRGEVFIDGEKVPRVCGVTFNAKVDNANEVVLTMRPDKVTIDGVARIGKRGTLVPEMRLNYG